MLPQIKKKSWPHRTAKGNPKSTATNVMYLLDHYGINVAWNVISNEVEIEFSDFENQFDVAWSYQAKRAALLSLLSLNELPKADLDDLLFAIAASNKINPALDLMSEEWDGESRIRDLLDTLTLKEGFCPDKAELLLRKWLISVAAAAAMDKSFRCRGVLVLQGPQSVGKTDWFRRLFPNDKKKLFKADHYINPQDKDTLITGSQHLVLELGELDSMLKRVDSARLNGYLTADTDKIRLPYAKTASDFPRKTVFCGTTNPGSFLSDLTGTTRWWVLPVTDVALDSGINIKQVWAEAYTLFKNKEPWWLTREQEEQLEKNNLSFSESSPIEDLICNTFDIESNEFEEELTSTKVLQIIGYDQPTKAMAAECGRILNKLFKHLGTQRRMKYGNVYPVPRRLGHRRD